MPSWVVGSEELSDCDFLILIYPITGWIRIIQLFLLPNQLQTNE